MPCDLIDHLCRGPCTEDTMGVRVEERNRVPDTELGRMCFSDTERDG